MNEMRKPIILKCLAFALMMLSLAMPSIAQDNRGFNPEKFKADLEKFITVEACLTPAEASKFFPLYDEMNSKQRALFGKMRELKWMRPADEESCKRVIADIDRIELEIKQLQANYHARFLTVISARKLFDVIRAEGKFHREAVKKAAKRPWHRP